MPGSSLSNQDTVPITTRHQQLPKMPVSSQPNMGTDSAATTNAFSTKSAADRITSYMWYVHVLVRVNTEERLRANIAPLLEHSSTFSSSSSSSLSSSAFASPTVSEVLLSPGTNFTTQSGRASMDDQHNRRDHEMTDDLTDHLILWLFNHKILAYLVERPPVLEQAIGYTRSLSDVPEAFREEFCRRLYTLLFSKRVVEWPHGIDVPVPTVGAAQPVVVADGGEAATAAATTTTTKTPAGVVELEEVEGTHLEHPWPPPPMEEPPQNDGDNEHDDNKNHNNNSNKRSSSTRASSPVAGSRWMRTPTPSTFCYDSEMEQGGYFGTVDNPMPLNSLGNLSRSRNGYGPPPPVGIDEQGEYASCGQQPMPPFPSPQPIAITPVGFQVSRPFSFPLFFFFFFSLESLSPPYSRSWKVHTSISTLVQKESVTRGSPGSVPRTTPSFLTEGNRT